MARDDLRTLFDAVNDALFEAVTGLSDEQFRRRPGGGQWSIVEVLAHLAAERRRIQARLVHVRGGMVSAARDLNDEDRAQQASLGRRLPPPQILHDLIGSHRGIRNAITGDLIPTSPTNTRSAVTPTCEAESAVRRLIEHELEHFAQIWAIRRIVSESIELTERNARPDESARTFTAGNSLNSKG